ncbi:MAG: hypothetical protein E7619_02150 [Ruminococcaceae bacterium]|nr:hypothetical protein [Oscillospiraceae bacterium]
MNNNRAPKNNGTPPPRRTSPQRPQQSAGNPSPHVRPSDPNARKTAPNTANNSPRPQRPYGNDVAELSSRRRYIAEKKSARRAGIIAFFTVFLSLCLITAGIFALLINKGQDTGANDFMIMNIEGSPKVEIPMSEAYQNEMLYIDFSAVAKLCGFSAVGDASGITYAFTSSSGIDQYITFRFDSNSVTVNGHDVTMEGIAFMKDEVLRIPFSFIDANISGLVAEVDEKERTVTITREKMTGSRPDDPKYEEIVLLLQPEIPVTSPFEGEEDVPDPMDVEFISDLSEYEQYMNPADRDAYLILINKENPVDHTFGPDDLEYVPQKYAVYSGEYQATMRAIAAKALTAMLTEAENYGINDVKVTLAYRNYWTQNWLYTGYIDEEMAKGLSREQAEEIVKTYSAPPGCSEHQSGLGADMHNVYFQTDKELEDFEYTEAYKWLKDNCWKFGFVVRFPKGKEHITGFQFECWHYRFVGRYHAYQMYTQDLCLEEYLQKLASEN